MHPFQENGNISAFLGKLWKMVNDPSTDHLISWNEAGNSFIIHNQAQFWYELLPVYYKHNNMSSFVRQLNMYGFHKITSLENSSLTATQQSELQSVQFYHSYFQKDEPEKLKEIKRKATKPTGEVHQTVIRSDDLTKVLTDVKQLRGRQSSVDSQLSAMKQENAVLWRELAILRQKHIKQQQIVNKLIQFLVTLVQPSTPPRMGVGVKRRMPLMLHEHPPKKTRAKKNGRQHIDPGPTIHELDPDSELFSEQLLDEASSIDEVPLETAVSKMDKPKKIDSPITPGSQGGKEPTPAKRITSPTSSNHSDAATNWSQQNESSFWDEPDFASLDDEVTENEELINSLQKNREAEKVFLNPNSRDALLGNLLSTGTSNTVAGGKAVGTTKKQVGGQALQSNMKVAKKTPGVKINTGTPGTNGFRTDLDLHVDTTQTELDQLKDILNGCSTFDPTTLLGLFSENDTQYGIKNTVPDKENPADEEEDFPELFDDDDLNNATSNLAADVILAPSNSGLNTPIIVKSEPNFPNRGA